MWNRIKAIWQSFGRFIAVIVAALMLLAFGNVSAVMAVVIVLFAFGLLNYGLKGKGIVQIIGNVVLVICMLGSSGFRNTFSEYLPLTSKSIKTVPVKVDVEIAERTFDPGVEAEAKNMAARFVIDSGFVAVYKVQLDMLLESARTGLISWDSALVILNDSFVPRLGAYQAEQLQKEFQAARKKSSVSQSLDTVVYQVFNERMVVAHVAPHSQLVLRAFTEGYVCDPANGRISSVDGYSARVYELEYPDGFPAPGERVFCLLAKLGTKPLQPFVNSVCSLINETNEELTCTVTLNERNDWSDNSGAIHIVSQQEPL